MEGCIGALLSDHITLQKQAPREAVHVLLLLGLAHGGMARALVIPVRQIARESSSAKA